MCSYNICSSCMTCMSLFFFLVCFTVFALFLGIPLPLAGPFAFEIGAVSLAVF